MGKKFTNFRKHDFTFILLNLYLIIMIFLPKQYSIILGIPIRLAITVIFILISLYRIKKKKVKTNDINNKFLILLVILFLISSIPSLFVSKAIFTSFYTVFKFLTIFLLLFVLLKIKFEKKEYIMLIKNLFICTFIISIIGIVQYIFNWNLLVEFSGIEHYPGAKGRVSTTFFNTIYYSIFINFVFALVFYLLNKAKKTKHIILLGLLSMLLYVNLIFTFTRSAVIVFIVVLALLTILLNKLLLNKRTLFVAIGIIALTLLIPGAKPLVIKTGNDFISMAGNIVSFLPGIDIKDRLFKDYDEDSDFIDYSLQHREQFAAIAKKVASNNPLTGVGFGAYIDYMNSSDFDLNYPEYTLEKTHPHSTLILISAELGYLGVIAISLLFVGLILKTFIPLFKYYKLNKEIYEVYSVIFCITVGYVIVNAMSENAIYDTQIGYLFVVIYGLLVGYCHNNLSKKNKKVLFISSTGGHLSELLQLKPLFKKYNSYLITEKTKSSIGLKKQYEKVDYLVYGTKDHKLSYIFKFMFNCLKSLILYIKICPEVIVTTGTHTAVPMCYIGKLFGSKIIFIETFANSETKTLSGRLVYPIADTFIVQWESMLELYPKAIYGGWIY